LHSSGNPSGSPNSARISRPRGPLRIASKRTSLVLDLHAVVDAVVDPPAARRVRIREVRALQQLGAGSLLPGLVARDRERPLAAAHLGCDLERVVRLLP